MEVSPEVMAFRRERAKELREVATLIDNLQIGSSHPIYNAAQTLEDSSQVPQLTGGASSPDYWGYKVENLRFVIPLMRHVDPKVDNLELIINLNFVADFEAWEHMCDPTKEFSLDVLLRGVRTGKRVYYNSFHIDRHPDEGNDPEEIHPKYHLHFGGRQIQRNSNFYNGNVLLVDTPRALCYPMDLFISLDFILSNYLPQVRMNLLEDRSFIKLLKQYQKCILKPYFHCLAGHWPNYNTSEHRWSPIKIYPNLI